MIVEFLPLAKSELLDAVAYYEGELYGLGQRLRMRSRGSRPTATSSIIAIRPA